MLAFACDHLSLLNFAPEVLNIYNPEHNKLLLELENFAKRIIKNKENVSFDNKVDFFVNIAFLKQPHKVDKERIKIRISSASNEIEKAIQSLRDIELIDYDAAYSIEKIPYFGGKNGRRAFVSAVLRICYPEKYGIVDWRNLAVITGTKPFDGLFTEKITIQKLSNEDILKYRGQLLIDHEKYKQYNEYLRYLATQYILRPADIDLILWTYSYKKYPFLCKTNPKESLFLKIFEPLKKNRIILLGKERKNIIDSAINRYLYELYEDGPVKTSIIRKELASIFEFVSQECYMYASTLHKNSSARIRCTEIGNQLSHFAKKLSSERLIDKLDEWEQKLNPGSPLWRGPDLPGTMIMKGFFVLENFIPIREEIKKIYDSLTFEPLSNLEE